MAWCLDMAKLYLTPTALPVSTTAHNSSSFPEKSAAHILLVVIIFLPVKLSHSLCIILHRLDVLLLFPDVSSRDAPQNHLRICLQTVSAT